MNNVDLLKKIESLESRIKALESEKRDNLSMFGRSYSLAGNSNSDFLIKTKGQVKIQWGSKFIDLIKDGKINVDAQFIFKANDFDSIGIKDGLYVLPDGQIYLKTDSQIVNLAGEVGTTYVSFLAELDTDPESKHLALTNIGFLYKDMESIDLNSLRNGIIYIESELKLYIVQDGALSEFTILFPNPFTKQFIIAKETAERGALVIRGEGIENSIAFELLLIYNDNGNSYINSDGRIYLQIGDISKMEVSKDTISLLVNTACNRFQSPEATSTNGFRLYLVNGESTLEVDNLVVRKSGNSDGAEFVIPTYWYKNNNIITYAEDKRRTVGENVEYRYELTLKYQNSYNVGNRLYAYFPLLVEDNKFPTLVPIPLTVIAEEIEPPLEGETPEVIVKNTVWVKVESNLLDEDIKELLSDDTLVNSFKGRTIFYICGSTSETVLKRSGNSMDVVEISDFGDETIKIRVGDLSEIDSNYGYGIYSAVGLIDEIHSKNIITEDIKADTGTIDDLQSTNGTIDTLSSTNGTIETLGSTTATITNATVTTGSVKTLTSEDGTFDKALFKGNAWANVPYFSAPLNQKLLSATESSSHYKQAIPTIEWVQNYVDSLIKPGYYWSSGRSGNTPTDPEYIGPSSEGFSVSESKPYLWYTNDGATFTLVNMFISPDPNKIYIISSSLSSYLDSASNRTYRYPAGFIQYYKNGATVNAGLGLDGWVNVESSGTAPGPLTKLDGLISSSLAGGVPSAEGYQYVWWINTSDDKKDYQKWHSEAQFGIDSSLVKTVIPSDWGNMSCRPGYTVWKTDASGKVVGPADSSEYNNGYGTPTSWNNEVWRISFLRQILSDFLRQNKHRYNSNLGWSLNWDGPIACVGFGGMWTGRVGGILAPSSNDPSNIGYKPTATLSYIQGYVIGFDYSVHFYFNNVRLGDLITTLGVGAGARLVGEYVESKAPFFKVSYESFGATILKLEANTVTQY